MSRWLVVIVFVIIIISICGCSERERVVLQQPTKIEIIGPDPRLMEKVGTKKPIPTGSDNSTALEIMKNNNMVCVNDQDKLGSLQSYTQTLLNSLRSRPDQILVK